MKTRILEAAFALAALVPASQAATSFTNASGGNVTGITNLLSTLPAEYSSDGTHIGGLIFGGAAANVSTLTDGQAPLASPPGGTNNALNQFAVFGGDVFTYSLGGAFDITKVDIYNSWTDGGRDDFGNVTIEFSTDGSNYFNLVSGLSTSGNNGNVVVNSGVTGAGSVIAAGATHIRFIFAGLENGAIGISELAVQGTAAIPEPSTCVAIFGVLALGTATHRRRVARA